MTRDRHTYACDGEVCIPDEVARTRNDLWIRLFLNTGTAVPT
jgi:hypothetical protein